MLYCVYVVTVAYLLVTQAVPGRVRIDTPRRGIDTMPYKDKVKQREYQREWIARRRQEWLDENGPCILCGGDNELQVDHIDPNTKISHRVWSWSDERRNTELAKCRVLCSRCHKEKSDTEKLRGEDQPQAKLTEQDVLAIRAEYKRGVRGKGLRALADKYKVDHKLIQAIIRRNNWQHI